MSAQPWLPVHGDRCDLKVQRENPNHVARCDCGAEFFTEEMARALFLASGWKVLRTWELVNGYWHMPTPHTGSWWLILTDHGPVRVGWRKRVLEIEWDATALRGIVTEDDVTKDETLVHAYSLPKAVQYLHALRALAPRLLT